LTPRSMPITVIATPENLGTDGTFSSFFPGGAGKRPVCPRVF
jgi:hypothetical protein